MDKDSNVEWDYKGKLNLTMGTGASSAENTIGWISSIIVPLFLLYILSRGQVDWGIFKVIVILIIAFDIGGGVVCNCLNSCKRFYHSGKKDNEAKFVGIVKNKLLFSAFHIHTIVVWLIFDKTNWYHGVIWYMLLLLSVLIVYYVPLYLKRPVSMLLIMIAIMINFYVIKPILGIEWLIPLLFIKIVYGHLVQEEPYKK